jgi:hypothetical protein
MIVLKLRGARQRMKIRTGLCEGANPYGSFAGGQVVMERITALRAGGEGFEAITSILNREGHRPRAVPDDMVCDQQDLFLASQSTT